MGDWGWRLIKLGAMILTVKYARHVAGESGWLYLGVIGVALAWYTLALLEGAYRREAKRG